MAKLQKLSDKQTKSHPIFCKIMQFQFFFLIFAAENKEIKTSDEKINGNEMGLHGSTRNGKC